MFYEAIKNYYVMNLYTEENLDLFVSINWITAEQKVEIMASKKV